MAQLFPSRQQCLPRMTAGERRLSERLEHKLEDDYLVWYNVPVGPKQLRPDFVILHPSRGLLVLEVKDWKLDTIRLMDRGFTTLLTPNGLVEQKNPLTQARVYALEVSTLLQGDPALRQPAGQRFAGKLCMPFGYGVVLSNITRREFNDSDLGEVLEPRLVMCRDEMFESIDNEVFQKSLWDMFQVAFPCQLTLPQIDRVRWHMYPEVRVCNEHGQFGLFDESDAVTVPDIVKVMDTQQELLARSLGAGHRIIHGVAGSGKTMILGFRAQRLAQATRKPVLILCYNRSLAGRLQDVIRSKKLQDKVQVHNFHQWCRLMLKSFHVTLPRSRADMDDSMRQLVEATITAVDKGHIPRAQYGAILIDEGHDFEPDWFKLVVQMVDPSSNSLLVLYDDAQSIYQNPQRRSFSFSSVGIQARGRTTILRLNYRNSAEVLRLAQHFAEDILKEHDCDEDAIPVLSPESAGRHGPNPVLREYPDVVAESEGLIQELRQAHRDDQSWNDVAILYRTNKQAEQLEHTLQQANIPFVSARSSQGKSALYAQAGIKLVSMHSSKGLEFPHVVIPSLHSMPLRNCNTVDEARLLYVAMTRSTQSLTLSHWGQSEFTRRIARSLRQAQPA